MSALFSEFTLRELTVRNRIVMSPMSQYSASDGSAQPWHMAHLGSRAVGGVGIVMVEATAVSPEGRLTLDDLGLWSDAHVDALRPITDFVRKQGAVPGIQLAHSGRKGARFSPWQGNGPLDDARQWPLLAPSAIHFAEGWQIPREMDEADILSTVSAFRAAARRARLAGFDIIEGHFAHGYLMHSFLSPLSNKRQDRYGGSLERRATVPLMVARAMREEWPQHLPVFVRLSVVDWAEGGLDLDQSVQVSKWLRDVGVDLIDCSSGAVVPNERAPIAPGYQVPFAAEIRRQVGIATAAVGLITEPAQAEEVLANGSADLVFLARALVRDPYWAAKASEALEDQSRWPIQYARSVARKRAPSAW
jgi:2,4-dienoyl-CoA reductase-like NADH-dependent reductase (Old Yellow Enzyme family)